MADSSNRYRAAHVSGAPEESYLLNVQFEHEELDIEVIPVANQTDLDAALKTPLSLVIADLPLPWKGAETTIDALQTTRPDLPIVFRWGSAGAWNVEDATTQLGRSVRAALAVGFDRDLPAAHRKEMLDEVVRYQKAHLELTKLDTTDWEESLQQSTRIVAETTGAERVSVWRLAVDGRALECEILYSRSHKRHFVGGALPLDAAYRRAIESATFVAAHDAQKDPRTSAFSHDYLSPLGITSMLDAPIRLGGQVAGVICLEHVGPQRRWNVVEQCAAAAFASIAGRILEGRERKQLEEQWQEAKRLEVIGRMAGAVAHDFSNLSTVIVGFSESLLAETPADDPRREAIQAIHEAGTSATALVRQLLAYSKGQPHEARTLDVCNELRVMEPLVRRLLGPGIAFTVSIPADPLWVKIEAAQLHRVVLNLAANSRDAMPNGGTFQLVLDSLPPSDDPLRPAGVVRLRAIDTGEGIPDDVMPHIFKPLYTTKADWGGTGLGLSAARAICTQAGGAIRVESEVKVSTTFSVELPRISPPKANETAGRQMIHPSLAGTVLVVDDTPTIVTLLKRVLERQGCRVEAATSPSQAIEIAALLGDDLGLLITDYNMRGMTGTQLIAVLRESRPGLPTLIITGQTEAEDLAGLAASPYTGVLGKPFEMHVLVSRVRELMSRQGGAATAPRI